MTRNKDGRFVCYGPGGALDAASRLRARKIPDRFARRLLLSFSDGAHFVAGRHSKDLWLS